LIKYIFISFLLLSGVTNTLSSQSFSDTMYYIQLPEMKLAPSDKKNGKFNIPHPDGPCMSHLIFSTNGERFKINSSDLKAQGHVTNNILYSNKLTVADIYNLNKTMKIDYLDDFPFFHIQDIEITKPLHYSKFSITYESFLSKSALDYFGKDFAAIQVAGQAKMGIKRKGLKTVFIGNIEREVNLVSFAVELKPTSAFIIDSDSAMKNLSQDELKRWFPTKSQTIWMLYDADSGRVLWKTQLRDRNILSQNRFFLDQALNNKPACGDLGDSNAYLYPNPSFGDVKLQIHNFPRGEYIFEVYNVIGKKLYSEPITVSTDSVVKQFRLKGLSKGTYLYSILDASGRRVQSKRLTIVGY